MKDAELRKVLKRELTEFLEVAHPIVSIGAKAVKNKDAELELAMLELTNIALDTFIGFVIAKVRACPEPAAPVQ